MKMTSSGKEDGSFCGFLRQGGGYFRSASASARVANSVNVNASPRTDAGRPQAAMASAMAALSHRRQGSGQGVGQGFSPQQEGSLDDPEEERLIPDGHRRAPSGGRTAERWRSPWGRAEISPGGRQRDSSVSISYCSRRGEAPPSALPWAAVSRWAASFWIRTVMDSMAGVSTSAVSTGVVML